MKNLLFNVKTYVFSIAFLFIGGITLSGQINIQAGLNASSLRIESDGFTIETDGKPGIHIGAMYRTRISNSFFFTSGAHFSQKGASFAGIFDFTLNYIDIPLLFVYQKDPERGFYADFGLYAAALISANSEGEDIKDGFKSADFGLMLGAGYDFGRIMVGLRGGIGFLNVTADDDVGSSGDKAVNSNGQLYVAFKI